MVARKMTNWCETVQSIYPQVDPVETEKLDFPKQIKT